MADVVQSYFDKWEERYQKHGFTITEEEEEEEWEDEEEREEEREGSISS